MFTSTFDDKNNRVFNSAIGALQYQDYSQITNICNSSIVFLSGSSPIRQLNWIYQLKANNFTGMIAVDVFKDYCIEFPKQTKKVLQLANICFMNSEEQRIINSTPVNSKMLIIKDGANGAALYYNKKKLSVPPKKSVVPYDTNGAGDILAGSFLSFLLEGFSYHVALTKAVNIATLSVTKKGVLHLLEKCHV